MLSPLSAATLSATAMAARRLGWVQNIRQGIPFLLQSSKRNCGILNKTQPFSVRLKLTMESNYNKRQVVKHYIQLYSVVKILNTSDEHQALSLSFTKSQTMFSTNTFLSLLFSILSDWKGYEHKTGYFYKRRKP